MSKDISKVDSKRIGVDEYFMKIAFVVAERSTCLRRMVGAIVVKDRHILTTGYNGAPAGIKSSLEIGSCLRDELKIPSGKDKHICRAVHAEQNAIIQGGKFGIKIRGGTLYCTHTTCLTCAKMIINAGLTRVVTSAKRHEEDAVELFNKAGIEFVRMPAPDMKINQRKYREMLENLQ